MMKICFLTGANSIHSQKWVNYFARRGHEIHWLSLGLDLDKKNLAQKIKFYCVKKTPLKLLRPLKYIYSLKQLLSKIRPDILHSHQIWIEAIVAAASGFHPLIITPWGSDILLGSKSLIKKPLIKYCLQRADLITCDAQHLKKALIKLGVPATKIQIINFGVDIQKFSPGAKDKNLQEELKIRNYPIVISIRNLEPLYDLPTLIRAIPLVLKKFPTAKFIIAGQGTERQKLVRLAQKLKAWPSVRFAGAIDNEKIPRYLRTADIYVSTALSDAGIAASTAEAMACGLAVAITDSGENTKWIKNGQNGFIIPVKNHQVLARKIIELLQNPQLRARFGRRARQLIIKKNNYHKEMTKMEKIYQKFNKRYASQSIG